MKTRTSFCFCCILLVLFAASGIATTAASGSEAASSRQSQVEQAILLCADGHLERAEAVLVNSNRSRKGTGSWHIESAHRLLEIALYFRSHDDGEVAVALSKRALSQVDQAVTLFRARHDARGEAAAWKAKGSICEELLGQIEEASSFYGESVRLKPDRENQRLLSHAQKAVSASKRRNR